MDDPKMTGPESLSVINEMIQRVKSSYHESGTSALLWGTVVGIAGIVSFLERQFNFSIGFDIWLFVLFAIIPQIIISIRENRKQKFKSYTSDAIDTVWIVFGITIFALVFYGNIVPGATEKIIKDEGWEMIKHYSDGKTADEHLKPFVLSFGSVFLIIYALPTLITGLIARFKPMIFGAVICYMLFIISCFTESKYDVLFAGIAGICAWLIPGFMLRKRFLKSKMSNV